MQKAIYPYNDKTHAQYRTAPLEMGYGHVSNGRFEQKRFIGFHSQVGWHVIEECQAGRISLFE
jgi:hypothetical protein